MSIANKVQSDTALLINKTKLFFQRYPLKNKFADWFNFVTFVQTSYSKANHLRLVACIEWEDNGLKHPRQGVMQRVKLQKLRFIKMV